MAKTKPAEESVEEVDPNAPEGQPGAAPGVTVGKPQPEDANADTRDDEIAELKRQLAEQKQRAADAEALATELAEGPAPDAPRTRDPAKAPKFIKTRAYGENRGEVGLTSYNQNGWTYDLSGKPLHPHD